MENLITRHNKKPLSKREKLPFLYAMGGYNKKLPLIRPSITKEKNMFGTPQNKLTLGKSQNTIRKGTIYSEDTYSKAGKLDYTKSDLGGVARSLDAMYYIFLGYNELNSTKDNYIKFLKEYLEYFLHIVIDADKFVNGKYYLKKYHNFNPKVNHIWFPVILLCGDVGKFTIHKTAINLTDSMSPDDSNIDIHKKKIKKLFSYNSNIICDCFSNKKNIDYLLNGYSDKLSSIQYYSEVSTETINFITCYSSTISTFTDPSGIIENNDNEYDKYDEVYLNLFPGKSLSELFVKAFELTKEEYKNDFNLFK